MGEMGATQADLIETAKIPSEKKLDGNISNEICTIYYV